MTRHCDKKRQMKKLSEKLIWICLLLIVKKIVVPVQKIHVREHAQQGGTHVCHVQVE